MSSARSSGATYDGSPKHTVDDQLATRSLDGTLEGSSEGTALDVDGQLTTALSPKGIIITI